MGTHGQLEPVETLRPLAETELPLAERRCTSLTPSIDQPIADRICAYVEERGVSPSRAAVLCGHRPESVRRWRRLYPHFAQQLRAAFQAHRAARQASAESPSAQPDPLADPTSSASPILTPSPFGKDPVGPGRPSHYSEAVVELICAHVRHDGVADSRAGLLAGVSRKTISVWKRDHAEFAERLEAARTEFQRECLDEIRNAVSGAGRLDWRARAWLLERTFPEEFGRTRRPAAPQIEPIPMPTESLTPSSRTE